MGSTRMFVMVVLTFELLMVLTVMHSVNQIILQCRHGNSQTSREIENLATPTPNSLETRGADPVLSTNEKESLSVNGSA